MGVVFLVLVALAVGLTIVGPQLVDTPVLDDHQTGPTSIDTDSPPSAGDREPDRTDPNDPNESEYESATVVVDAEVVEDGVHHEVNEVRSAHGLDPIEWDGTVASVARAHSADMHDRDYFDHVNPDGAGPFDRFTAVAGYCRGYGENIARTWIDRDVHQPDADETVRHETTTELAEGLVEQWLNSPPHREAILDDSWDRGGVGVYLTDDGEVFATHNFCLEW